MDYFSVKNILGEWLYIYPKDQQVKVYIIILKLYLFVNSKVNLWKEFKYFIKII